MSNTYQDLKKEYEEFAYIISHDLNAPLRHLKQFSELLIAEREKDDNEAEKQYLHFMRKSLTKLEDMQEALLAFSRINTQAADMEFIETDGLVASVVKAVKKKYTDHNVTINCSAFPNVAGDIAQLRNALYNIIDNAIKFHPVDYDGERRCDISVKDQGDRFLFQIQDNGIGIDFKHHEEIFKIFRFLNGEDDYEGIGAGLAFARKIINRHNGQIWVDSEGVNGSTIFFTIPKQ